jgi:hypothetical protein
MTKTRQLLLGAAAIPAAAYATYAVWTWLRYGRRWPSRKGEGDLLLDRFMPEYEIVERHSAEVEAPAEITFETACSVDFADSRIARAVFKFRDLLFGTKPSAEELPGGLLAKTKALGWGVLAEVPGREIVMGAVTQPWMSNVVFRALSPEEFVSFRHPEYVKIAWGLCADPVNAGESIFRTETRAQACGPVARSKFRRYWAFLSPGIILIRMAMLGPVRREAERRAQDVLLNRTAPAPARNPT